MRKGSRLSVVVVAVAAIVVSATAAAPRISAAAPSATQQLLARRAALVAQLDALSGPEATARQALLSVENQLATVQAQLVAARRHLDALDSSLQRLARQIADNERTLATARARLASLVRLTYEASSDDALATAIVSSSSFGEAMDRMRSAQHVGDQVATLLQEVRTRDRALVAERAALQRDGAAATAAEQALGDQSNRLAVLVAQRDQELAAITGPARAIASEIAAIDLQLAGPAPRVASSGSCGNHFAYGYCTYYVATRRCVPWFGNAWQWWGAAAAMGYQEGHVPARGAIAVFGRSASSPDGHVAYVEAVGPAPGIPAGSFLVSEMNYGRWNTVDQRVVADDAPGLLGFIY